MKVPLIKGFLGMNNRIDPKRLRLDGESLTSMAATVTNMRINESLEAERDYGRTLVLSDEYHSIYSSKGNCYVGNGSTIHRFMPDGTSLQVVTGLSGRRFSYARLAGMVLYSDTIANKGALVGNNAYPWQKQTHIPEEYSDRPFEGPPVPRHMAILNGRMYMVPADNPDILLWSERGQLGLYNFADNHRRFESDILMVAAVKAGLFVSTRNRTVFLRITSPHNIDLEPRVSYPAVEWSLSHQEKDGISLGLEIGGLCRFWRSKEGHCIGTPGGELYNMTQDNIIMPENCDNSGASILVGSYFYSAGK